MHRLYANTMPFHIRNLNITVLGPGTNPLRIPRDKCTRVYCVLRTVLKCYTGIISFIISYWPCMEGTISFLYKWRSWRIRNLSTVLKRQSWDFELDLLHPRAMALTVLGSPCPPVCDDGLPVWASLSCYSKNFSRKENYDLFSFVFQEPWQDSWHKVHAY